MGGHTIGLDFNNGFAGGYARQPDMIIDTHSYADASGNTPAYFGDPLALNADGSVSRAGASFTAAAFAKVIFA
jgi:hypothetical protein